jgi:copper/silver efflux system protein
LHWPSGANEEKTLHALAGKLIPKYGLWLAKHPSLEDVNGLTKDVGTELKEKGAIEDPAAALTRKQSLSRRVLEQAGEFFGLSRETFAGEVQKAVERERIAEWRHGIKKTNWELFDRAIEAYTWLALEECVQSASRLGLLHGAPRGAESEQFVEEAVKAQVDQNADQRAFEPFFQLKDQLQEPFADRVFLWPRQSGPKGDLVDDEMGRVLQVPGWTNIFTQPIINRIEMLSTGVRTDIGVKVFGPDLDTIDRVAKEIETALKPINGARDVVAAPIMGKGYLEIDIDLERAARYGISAEDIRNTIEVALGGQPVTQTVEGRERFPVRIRYPRAQREDEDSVRKLLVSGSSMSASASPSETSMSSIDAAMRPRASEGVPAAAGEISHQAAPPHATGGKALQVPLGSVADVSIVEGPSMMRSENGQLMNYVTLKSAVDSRTSSRCMS